jgi:hypothetical protein
MTGYGTGGRGAAHEIAGSGALLAEDRLLGGRQLLQGRRAQRPKLVLFESLYLMWTLPSAQMNRMRIPHIPSMITVATIPATTAPPTMNRSANALLTPCAIMTARAPAARCARTKNAPSQ